MKRKNWTLENLKEEALKYNTRGDFQKGSKTAYNMSMRKGVLDDVCSHMPKMDISKNNNPNFKWTEEKILEEALKYSTRAEFKNNSSKAYGAAWRNKILDTVCSHMAEGCHRWSDEEIIQEALKYKTLVDFRKNSSKAYQLVGRRELEDKITHLIKNDKVGDNNPNFKWTKEKILEEALKYETRNDFAKNSPEAYSAACRSNILDLVCSHAPQHHKNKGENHHSFKWTNEDLQKEALKYNNRMEFAKNNNSAYLTALGRNILDTICSHMEYLCYPWNKDEIKEEAAKHKSRTEFSNNNSGAYRSAIHKGILDEVCSHMKILSGTSGPQKEIANFIREYNLETLEDETTLIKPYELDVYIPSLNLAIEYCGLRWHHEKSPTPRNSQYHLMKMNMSIEKGIRLITIFEDEWLYRQEQVKNFLLSVINKNSIKIMGRKTQLKQVPKAEAKIFLEQNHIQGSCLFEIAFGLYYQNELVGVITGNKHHRQNHENLFVLNRLAFKADVTVSGGSSKLLKALVNYAKQQGYTKLVSWSDNRWSEGNVYQKLGFVLTEELPPDYSYVRNQKRLSKQSCQKRCLLKKGAVGNTEKEMAESLGLYRIWDCGKKRWEIDI